MDFTEKTVRRNYIYRGKILSLRCDDAARPDGKPCKREIVEHSGGAAILCVVNGKVVLVRQYRYAYGEVLYEIPAGKLEKGEDPSSAARRELSEETGYETDSAELLFTLYPSPGYTDENIYVYEAAEVRAGTRHPDEGEFLSAVSIPLKEAYGMIERGEIRDAKTVAALLHLKSRE